MIWSFGDHFYDYFFESSPIKAISSFNIGSRPAARKTITEIGGLRAILRYSHGRKVASCSLAGMGLVQASRNLSIKNPENIAILRYVPKLAFLPIASFKCRHGLIKIKYEYCFLNMPNCVRMKKSKAIYETILNEWQVTKEVILAIEGYDELLAENPYLKASLDYRMPYFNILNYISWS